MSFRARICLALFAFVLASAVIALGETDPELKQCRDKCERQRFDKGTRELCIQRCEEYHKEKQSRRRGGGSEETVGWFEGGEDDNPVDPQKEYEQCRVQCGRQSEGSRYSKERCESDCQRQLKERERQHHRGDGESDAEREREQEQGEQQEQNPYVFEDRHFITGMQTQHGRVRILQKFTDRSKLLRGIENYRVTILEAEPQTFVVPNHFDADIVLFVAKGRGTVNLVRHDRRESFNIKQGDIMRINAGTTTYLINRDNRERLVLAKLLQPVNTPGQFESFFGAGGENPESFYRAFSDEILEAAFNTRRDRLQRLFGQQRQGVIIKASEEQIRAMSQQEEGGYWPFGRSRDTINLYQQRQTQSNQFGQLYGVDPSEYSQLQDLDIAVTLANISQGAMMAPHYNSKSTKISIVVEGEGYLEMACPHLSQGRQGGQSERPESRHGMRSGPRYQKVSSRLRPGTVVIVPAGHPFVTVASKNQNLQVLCFEVNASNNEKFPLAGRRNVIKQLEREAKELAFGMPARDVDEVFNSQKEEFFFKGPRQTQQGRAQE